MKSFSLNNILAEGKTAGCLVGGMIAGNVIIKMDKKGGLLFPAGLTAGGIIGASMIKNLYIKLLLLGVSTFGAIKLLNKMAALEGLAGEGMFGFKLPDGVKKMISEYVPNLGEASDVDYNKLLGDPLYLPELQPGIISANVSGLGEVDLYKLAG